MYHGSVFARGVSVITPSLNQGCYIDDCLRSVANQCGGMNIEQLVIDAGSTDETHAIVSTYPHARLISHPLSSQSEAINQGIRLAKHDLVCWLNSDDFLLPGALAMFLSRICNTPDRFFLYGDFYEIDKDKCFKRFRPIPPFVCGVVRNHAVYVPTSGSLFPKSVLDDGLLLHEELHYLMDRDFLIRLKEQGYKFCHVTKPTAAFRVHDAQKSHRNNVNPVRTAERLLLNRKYGGLYWGQRKVLNWNPILSFLGRAYISITSRLMITFSRQHAHARKYAILISSMKPSQQNSQKVTE